MQDHTSRDALRVRIHYDAFRALSGRVLSFLCQIIAALADTRRLLATRRSLRRESAEKREIARARKLLAARDVQEARPYPLCPIMSQPRLAADGISDRRHE